MYRYLIQRIPQEQSQELFRTKPQLETTLANTGFEGADWNSSYWKFAETINVSFFHPRSESTHPQTWCRVLYDTRFLYWSFVVNDRWVKAEFLAYQDPVCNDSCVEFFVQPVRGKGYFNFEVNCIGTMQLFYIEDPTRTETGFVKSTPVPVGDVAGIHIWSSIQDRPYLPENQKPVRWRIDAAVPFSLFGHYVPGFTTPSPGTEWRGNFFKCADASSHPHWASWAPLGDELNFHVPQYFGSLCFA
jgi:hypothetical protein